MRNRMDPQGWDTKVTYLGNGQYGCRVLQNGVIHSQATAKNKSRIRPTLKELLRWVDKLGHLSDMASASRDRLK